MIDITVARITHMEWMLQLETILSETATTTVALPSYHDCELGAFGSTAKGYITTRKFLRSACWRGVINTFMLQPIKLLLGITVLKLTLQ